MKVQPPYFCTLTAFSVSFFSFHMASASPVCQNWMILVLHFPSSLSYLVRNTFIYYSVLPLIITFPKLQRKLCFVFTVRACETSTSVCVNGLGSVRIVLTTVAFIWSVLTVSVSVTHHQSRDARTITAPELQLLLAGRQGVTCSKQRVYGYCAGYQSIR